MVRGSIASTSKYSLCPGLPFKFQLLSRFQVLIISISRTEDGNSQLGSCNKCQKAFCVSVQRNLFVLGTVTGSAQTLSNISMLISEGQLASAMPVLPVLGAGVIEISIAY